MANRILRVSYEGTYGQPHEIEKRTIDVIKYNSGEYFYKFTTFNENLEKHTIKNKIASDVVDKLLSALSKIIIPAFPKHQMGCDGGFTEIEVGGYEGKSHYRWWSCPPEGWEELDEITQLIIKNTAMKNA
jgi:hypothetical protein